MPIFEYRCGACGERFETLVSRADAETPRCPRCGASHAERMISSFAVTGTQPRRPAGPCGSDDCACRQP